MGIERKMRLTKRRTISMLPSHLTLLPLPLDLYIHSPPCTTITYSDLVVHLMDFERWNLNRRTTTPTRVEKMQLQRRHSRSVMRERGCSVVKESRMCSEVIHRYARYTLFLAPLLFLLCLSFIYWFVNVGYLPNYKKGGWRHIHGRAYTMESCCAACSWYVASDDLTHVDALTYDLTNNNRRSGWNSAGCS